MTADYALLVRRNSIWPGYVAIYLLSDGCRVFGASGPTVEDAIANAEAAEVRHPWHAVIRVDGEVGDCLYPDERDDQPSRTDWQAGVDAERLLEEMAP